MTIVPGGLPYILAGIVVEIDMGTQGRNHSLSERYTQTPLIIAAIDRYLASGSRRQCDHHQLCLSYATRGVARAAFLCGLMRELINGRLTRSPWWEYI